MSENIIGSGQQISTEDVSVDNAEERINGNGEKVEVKEHDEVKVEDCLKEEVQQTKVEANGNQEEVKQQEAPQGKKKKGKKKEQLLTITAKELKMMNKKIDQLDVVKEQYQKMRKNYELLRTDRDQFKNNFEQANEKNQQIQHQLQGKQQYLSNTKAERDKLRKEKEDLIKRIQQSRKKEEDRYSLEEKVKQLEMIIDMTTNNLLELKKEKDKMQTEIDKGKQLLKYEKDGNNKIKTQVERLRLVEGETFVLKQQLVRITGQFQNLKVQKEQMPIMMDKFQHQEQMIKELKDKIKQIQSKYQDSKIINQKFQKKTNSLIQQKRQIQKKYQKVRINLQESYGKIDALKLQLQQETQQWQIQKKRYTTEVRTLKTELHNEHQKLKIIQWELSQSKKKEKKAVQVERVNVMDLKKEDLLNILEQMEMKNQSLKITLDSIANTIHQKDIKIKQQNEAIMALARELTKDYPNYAQSEGMEYVQKDILQMGRQKKQDWPQIVQKVMIQNLRLKFSVTALGEQYNQKLRRQFQK